VNTNQREQYRGTIRLFIGTGRTLQETHKFSWAVLFSSADLRKFECYFRRPRDRRKYDVFSWAGEYFRGQAHENTVVIFVGL
jgi:hypothetical protein